MVESNVVAASSLALDDDEAGDNGSKIIADKNLTFLRSQASSWLAVLFNVFGTTARDARTTVGEVIASWITVTSEQVRCCFLLLVEASD
jgi:ribosomal RNA-processing protein 12